MKNNMKRYLAMVEWQLRNLPQDKRRQIIKDIRYEMELRKIQEGLTDDELILAMDTPRQMAARHGGLNTPIYAADVPDLDADEKEVRKQAEKAARRQKEEARRERDEQRRQREKERRAAREREREKGTSKQWDVSLPRIFATIVIVMIGMRALPMLMRLFFGIVGGILGAVPALLGVVLSVVLGVVACAIVLPMVFFGLSLFFRIFFGILRAIFSPIF